MSMPQVDETKVKKLPNKAVKLHESPSITKEDFLEWVEGLENAEISTVQEHVNHELLSRREARVTALREEAELLGIKLGEKRGPKVGGSMPPKYRNPETGETWSGRGARTRWLTAAIAAGKKLEDFAV
jgi:DNA-binding protein H-NS